MKYSACKSRSCSSANFPLAVMSTNMEERPVTIDTLLLPALVQDNAVFNLEVHSIHSIRDLADLEPMVRKQLWLRPCVALEYAVCSLHKQQPWYGTCSDKVQWLVQPSNRYVEYT